MLIAMRLPEENFKTGPVLMKDWVHSRVLTGHKGELKGLEIIWAMYPLLSWLDLGE